LLRHYPDLRTKVESQLKDTFPLLFDPQGSQTPVDLQEVAKATLSAGIVSVLGLIYAGLGWVGATIEGVRRMLGALRRSGNGLMLRVKDAVLLLTMGLVLLVALVGGVLVQALGDRILKAVGLPGDSHWVLTATTAALAGLLIWLVLVSLYGLSWWHRPRRRWRTVFLGALLATVVLVLLMQLSFLVVGSTLNNPVYGVLAIAAALLIFLNIASQVMLYFASWVAVGEGAPETLEEAAFQDRDASGAIDLPFSSDEQPATDGATTTPPSEPRHRQPTT
jgi:membrane protein